MAGKPNEKVFKTMVEKHGGEEAARDWYRKIGAIGGARSKDGGFAKRKFCDCDIIMKPHTKPQCAGKKGGRNRWTSKKGKA